MDNLFKHDELKFNNLTFKTGEFLFDKLTMKAGVQYATIKFKTKFENKCLGVIVNELGSTDPRTIKVSVSNVWSDSFEIYGLNNRSDQRLLTRWVAFGY